MVTKGILYFNPLSSWSLVNYLWEPGFEEVGSAGDSPEGSAGDSPVGSAGEVSWWDHPVRHAIQPEIIIQWNISSRDTDQGHPVISGTPSPMVRFHSVFNFPMAVTELTKYCGSTENSNTVRKRTVWTEYPFPEPCRIFSILRNLWWWKDNLWPGHSFSWLLRYPH